MDILYVSEEGLQKLKTELEEAKAEMPKLSKEIEKARGFGDLRENAEFHAAKEAQSKLMERIGKLQEQLGRAQVVDESEIDSSKAYLGATVKVRNHKSNREVTYTLVSPVESDAASGKISIKSPVGQALAGKSVGEMAIAKVPAGDLKLEVLDITR